MPACSSTFSTRLGARPRAAPPLRAMPIFGGLGVWARPGAETSSRQTVSTRRGGRMAHSIVAPLDWQLQRNVALAQALRAKNCGGPAPVVTTDRWPRRLRRGEIGRAHV